MSSEFDLIRRFFVHPARHTDLAVGDDGALMTVSPGRQLVVSSDMLAEGTHFLAETDPRALGWKTLAVNLSDLAAMAATPRWVTLALCLPQADPQWLEAFSAGFVECCQAFDVDLVGGDTTRGPRNLCATVLGEVAAGAAVTRAGASPGHSLWVSGQPGRAALALDHLLGRRSLATAHVEEFVDALQRPQPRLALGRSLAGVASAMLDVSDGLLGDLGHLLASSGVGAELEHDSLPLQALLASACGNERALEALLHGGDDYELLFAAPTQLEAQVLACAKASETAVHCIGRITEPGGLIDLILPSGQRQRFAGKGYDHFA